MATPIGNLGDLSPRARETLGSVDTLLCEDTRHTGRLLATLGIRRPTRSLHEHNEAARVPEVVAGLREGRSYALVSDAGTPLVSDPGYRLLAELRRLDLPVRAVPGPCAAIAALSVAGLPGDRFCFEGFLPPRRAGRRRRLAELAAEPRSLVVYESGQRLADTLEDAAAVFGEDRPASLSRELTKLHESLYRASLGTLARQAREDAAMVRGEMVLVVQGAPPQAAEEVELSRLLAALLEELPPSRAVRIAARLTGVRRRRAYAAAVALGSDPGSDVK